MRSEHGNEKNVFIKGIIELALTFLLLIVILVLFILLITRTIGTTLGVVILLTVGISLVIVGSIILVRGIRDLFKAIRS